MSATITKLSHFLAMYEHVSREVTYNPKWENGTGYLDHAVTDKTIVDQDGKPLLPGDIVKSVTLKGRKILIIATRFGNFVLFQRYTDQPEYLVANMPHKLSMFFIGATGHIYDFTDESLTFLIGTECPLSRNIGSRIEHLLA